MLSGQSKKTEMDAEGEKQRKRTGLEVSGSCGITEVWAAILEMEGHLFTTAKGLEFQYTVKRHQGVAGKEIFVDRKMKSITRSSVEIALKKVYELGNGRLPAIVSGPKKLGVFGASYLYPIFVELGIILREQQKLFDNPSCFH